MGGLASRLAAAIRNTGCTCFDAVTHQTLGHDPFFLRSMCGLPARDEQDADVPPTLLYRMRMLFQDAWQHGDSEASLGRPLQTLQVRQRLHRAKVAPHDCQQNFLDGKMHCPADFYSHEMWKMHKESVALGHADSAVGQDGRFSTLDAAVAARPRSSVMNGRIVTVLSTITCGGCGGQCKLYQNQLVYTVSVSDDTVNPEAWSTLQE
jgi:hypothetical protein